MNNLFPDPFFPSPEGFTQAPKGALLATVGDMTPPSLQGQDEDLLGKILKAMKLSPGQYCRLSGKDHWPLAYCTPPYILALGGQAMEQLTGISQNLSEIHGQLFPLSSLDTQGEVFHSQVIPIFHPEYLKANESMKSLVWRDLKNLLRHMGQGDKING